MNFDVEAVLQTMLKAAETSLGKSWQAAKPTATDGLRKIALEVQAIQQQRLTEKISEQDAKDRLDNLKTATEIELNTAAGIAEEAAQNALNAALDAVSSIINSAIGFPVI